MPIVAFRDGEFSPLSEMTVGIQTTALHYGTNVFEGMRAYWNEDVEELYVFRAQDHFRAPPRVRIDLRHVPAVYRRRALCDHP